MNKLGLWIILVISASLVLYPSISALIDAQNAIAELHDVPEQFLAVRDKAIVQVLGLVFLFCFLGFFLKDYSQTQQTPQKETQKKDQYLTPKKSTSTLGKKSKTRILAITSLAFIGVFFLQFIPLALQGHSIMDTIDSAIAAIFYGLGAAIITAIVLYALFKYVIDIEQ